MAGGHHHVVKVKRETLESCMTCPLCNKLLKEATTNVKCIYEKLYEGMDCCPVCDIELGCLPVDKLRPDHNLQDIRAKIFPFKRRKIRAPEAMPSNSAPEKKEGKITIIIGGKYSQSVNADQLDWKENQSYCMENSCCFSRM